MFSFYKVLATLFRNGFSCGIHPGVRIGTAPLSLPGQRAALVVACASLLTAGCVTITSPQDKFQTSSNTVSAEVQFRSQLCAGTFSASLAGQNTQNVTGQFNSVPPGDTQRATLTLTPGSYTLNVSAQTLQYWILFPYCGAGSDSVSFTVLGPQPDLWPVVTGVSTTLGGSHRARFTISVHNLGQADAQNVSLLLQTAVPASLLQLQPTAGFSCYLPSGFGNRFGMNCDGGTVPRQTSVSFTVELSFPTSGSKVLAVNADPNNAIAESDETNNLANATVTVP